MDLKKLGEVLRKKRDDLGISAASLSRKAGIGRTTIWIVERGEDPKTGKPSRISKDKLERWGKGLLMNPLEVNQILGLAEYTAPPQQSMTATKEALLKKSSGPPLLFQTGAMAYQTPRSQEREELLQELNELLDLAEESDESWKNSCAYWNYSLRH